MIVAGKYVAGVGRSGEFERKFPMSDSFLHHR